MIKQTHAQLPQIKLIGIQARTNNLAEMNTATAKIAGTVQKYFSLKQNPGITYSVYTNYESDHTGEYTYFIGQEAAPSDNIPEGFTTITIPSQAYAKLTTGPGPMPDVCIGLWQKIWQMSSHELGGARSYLADFEIYDERAMDPQNTVLDIYVGISA